MKFECAFIYVAPGCDPAKERTVIEGDSINMNVTGCATSPRPRKSPRRWWPGLLRHQAVRRLPATRASPASSAVGPGIAVGAVKFDPPRLRVQSGDDMFG